MNFSVTDVGRDEKLQTSESICITIIFTLPYRLVRFRSRSSRLSLLFHSKSSEKPNFSYPHIMKMCTKEFFSLSSHLNAQISYFFISHGIFIVHIYFLNFFYLLFCCCFTFISLNELFDARVTSRKGFVWDQQNCIFLSTSFSSSPFFLARSKNFFHIHGARIIVMITAMIFPSSLCYCAVNRVIIFSPF